MKGFYNQNVLLIILLLFISCQDKKWEVSTEEINVDLNFERFDLELLEISENGITDEEVLQLKKDYPRLFPLYVQGIMQFGPTASSQSVVTLNDFMSNEDIKELFETVASTFPETALENEVKRLEEGFKRFNFHFPQLIVPEVKTMVAAFNYSTVASDSLLVIGLDNYLGKDYEVYASIGIPTYKFEKFDRQFIVSDAMKAWITTEFESADGLNLLEQMIYQGKILYLLEALLPDLDPWLKFSYFKEELEWCEENESEIWFHFVDMELLYTVENFKIKKYMGDAPFISGFPKGSPGRVGQWVGYKIVKSYMENHSDLNLEEMMGQVNASQFLQKSNYKPKRK
tara:strand:- start:11582 stop:12607 length:1026 start_codon:yes stop_codon:yes gene_type:complete